jgi:hypothetical protein
LEVTERSPVLGGAVKPAALPSPRQPGFGQVGVGTWLRIPFDQGSDESFLGVREPIVDWLAEDPRERVTAEVRLAHDLESSLRVFEEPRTHVGGTFASGQGDAVNAVWSHGEDEQRARAESDYSGARQLRM